MTPSARAAQLVNDILGGLIGTHSWLPGDALVKAIAAALREVERATWEQAWERAAAIAQEVAVAEAAPSDEFERGWEQAAFAIEVECLRRKEANQQQVASAEWEER